MNYSDMLQVRKGDTFDNNIVTCTIRIASGGVGMGEYPAEVYVVTNNGSVYCSDEWSKGYKKIA